MDGTIRSLKPSYGFIRTANGEDYFFLPTAIVESGRKFAELTEGQKVSFTPTQHPKGNRAVDISTVQ